MSFLNPVNEPVLRFKSTDAGAPQINYNARVAGDVKAVLKACLVTGYGAKASAGWSIVNEVGHVAEFVSPSASMSDYRLGIDDTSTSNTTWYYQYQDVRIDPAGNAVTKNFSHAKSGGNHGWQLLATERGVILIEITDNTVALGLVSRVTYWGKIKSSSKTEIGKNIAWWSLGQNGYDPTSFFKNTPPYNEHHYRVGDNIAPTVTAINSPRANTYIASDEFSSVEIVSAWYLYDGDKDTKSYGAIFVGEQPAVMLADCNNDAERFVVADRVFNERPVLSVPASYATGDLERYNLYTVTLLIALDFWEY